MNILTKNALKSTHAFNYKIIPKFSQFSKELINTFTTFSSLNHQNRFNYISPIDKPIGSLALNSII